MPGRFEGQGWIVTGGLRGIGRAIVEAAAREGAMVATCGRTPVETLVPVSGAAHQPTHFLADVRDEAQVDTLFDSVADVLGGIHVVINNAGVQCNKLLVDMELADWNTVLDTNVQGPFLMCRRAIEHFLSEGNAGSIVNIASFAANGLVGEAAYSASKSALLSLTRSVAKEWGRRGIRCNAVVPGFTDTGMTDMLDADARRARARLSPHNRFARGSEVADAVLFLASEDAAFVTGDALYVAGAVRDVPRL